MGVSTQAGIRALKMQNQPMAYYPGSRNGMWSKLSPNPTQERPTNMKSIKTWEERVQELEDLGADRSDAQAIVDAEDQ